MRTIMKNLKSKLGDDAEKTTYIFTEHLVCYGIPRGEGQGTEEHDDR